MGNDLYTDGSIEAHMQFRIKDILLTLISVLAVIALAAGTAMLAAPVLDALIGRYAPTVTVLLFIGAVFFFTALYARVLRLFQPYREGTFEVDGGTFMTFWKYYQLSNDWTQGVLGYVLPVSMRRCVYRLLGARLGNGVMIAGKLVEPPLIQIGDYSFMGENSVITAHAIEGGCVTLEKIVMGRNVTVGTLAVILPGVRIADHAMVAAGAVVLKGTHIGRGEIWAGVPARRVGMASPELTRESVRPWDTAAGSDCAPRPAGADAVARSGAPPR